MANEENLKKLSTKKAREIGAKGGKASGEARRQRKALKAQMEMLLSLPVRDTKSWNAMSEFGIEIDEIDNNTKLVYCLLKKAFTGDVAAIREVRAMIGEDPTVDVMKKLDEGLEGLDKV